MTSKRLYDLFERMLFWLPDMADKSPSRAIRFMGVLIGAPLNIVVLGFPAFAVFMIATLVEVWEQSDKSPR